MADQYQLIKLNGCWLLRPLARDLQKWGNIPIDNQPSERKGSLARLLQETKEISRGPLQLSENFYIFKRCADFWIRPALSLRIFCARGSGKRILEPNAKLQACISEKCGYRKFKNIHKIISNKISHSIKTTKSFKLSPQNFKREEAQSSSRTRIPKDQIR